MQKQLKLKVINSISNSNQPVEKVENRESRDGKDGSLFSYWNKAVEGFKTKANQFVKEEKTREAQQETPQE